MVVGAHKRAQGMHSAEVIDVIATPARVREDFFHIERTHRGRGAPIPGGETERWILCEGPRIDSEVEFFNELCWRLLGDGIPLWRANLHIGTLHPQTRGFGLRWWRERKVIEEYRVPGDWSRGIDSAQTVKLAGTITERLRREMGRHGY